MVERCRLRRRRARRARQRGRRQLARRGHSVLGLERFGLGHARGASHDSSRILRHSYHTPAYVRLTQEAYADWADLERECGEPLVTRTGGLDLFPPDPAIPSVDYTDAMDEVGVAYDALDADAGDGRWPQLRLPAGTLALFQEDAAIVPAGRTTAVLHEEARRLGAELRDQTPVLGIEDLGAPVGSPRRTGGHAGGVVVTADAWTNDVVAIRLHVPLEVTLEQVTYFALDRPEDFATCRCGSGWTTRRSTASRRTASRRSRPPRTAAARASRRTTAPASPDPGWSAAGRPPARDAARRRCAAAVGALPVHADPGPRLRAGAGPRSRARGRRPRRRPRVQVRADVRAAAGRPGDDRRDRRPTCRRSGSTGRR